MTDPRRRPKPARKLPPNPVRDLLRQVDELYVLDGEDSTDLAHSADHWSKLPAADRDFALAHLLRAQLAALSAQADLQILMVQRLDAIGRALHRQAELLHDLVEIQADDNDDDPDGDDPDGDDVALDAEGDLDEEPSAEEPANEEPPARPPRRTSPRPRRKAEAVEGEVVGEAQGDAGQFSHPPAEE